MENDGREQDTLALPAVTGLKKQAADLARGHMERSFSQDIREQRQELRDAAEQTKNMILDLGLDGKIRWVCPSWTDVVGTSLDEVKGKPVAQFITDNPLVFDDAVEKLKKDDSKSQIIVFTVRVGRTSDLGPLLEEAEKMQAGADIPELKEDGDTVETTTGLLQLQGQGIMVYDHSSGGESHTMWMLQPHEPREVKLNLPPLLDGLGAEVLANYLNTLAEVGANDPGHHPPPLPVLCRVCERSITPWWFERHSDLCVQEHKAEMEVQLAQEHLESQRQAIVRVLDALEARKGRPTSADAVTAAAAAQAEYKGLPIGPNSTPSSGSTSASGSHGGTPPRSRDPSASGMGHTRAKSFVVRRPLARIVELILDLCDTALEISTPAIKEDRRAFSEESPDHFRTQSPQSESRISQVYGWQTPSSSTLETEQGLAALSADTEIFARAKVDAVLRHRRILEYSERIRVEFTLQVEECISDALQEAERIATGENISSESEAEEGSTVALEGVTSEGLTPVGFEPLEAIQRVPTQELTPSASDPTLIDQFRLAPPPNDFPELSLDQYAERRPSSAAISSQSDSPMECPTPRSHKSAMGLLNQPQASKRSSMLVESDANDSDSSLPSSVLSGPWRTESPASEQGLSRATSTKDRKRRSMILPGLGGSPRRQSPARLPAPPHSPLRMAKPRIPSGESVPSPVTSPLLTHGEFISPALLAHHHHHRRQSSAHSSDVHRPPVSPRLTSVSHPQPRAVAPSIKDFEVIKPISKGAFGSVYLSKKKSTGEYFAIKVLKKSDMVAKNQVTNVKAERAIMMVQGESDFVAKLYWTFSSKDCLYLVMEYLNGGDCASLVKILGGLPEDWAKKYISEVVLGVEQLHSRGIVHRDLKPDNLLIDQKGHLKLTDFGLSRMGLVGRQKRILKDTNESAPESLKQDQFPRVISGSIASSRSTSFDFQSGQSPNNTPLMTPAAVNNLETPSYFSLSRDSLLRHEPSRRSSGQRSDSGSGLTDSFSNMFRSFSLSDPPEMPGLPLPPRSLPIDEETRSDVSGSPDLYPLHSTSSHGHPARPMQQTPPQQPMLPPPMALFDPSDNDRRFVGTPDYLAPETINGSGQDEMSDWWSLGCILFEFLYGFPPFNAEAPEEVFKNILALDIHWPDDDEVQVSPEARDLIEKLVVIDPRMRIGANLDEKFSSGAAEIRSHPWFADVNWNTLMEDEAQFVPAPENPEDTEYFDTRGASLESFPEEIEDQLSPQLTTPGGSAIPDRPHDALLSRVRHQVNASSKRGLMPLHIPPHVRDSRSRRLSEPAIADDFGNFTFKNLPVLEKANKDVLQKIRAEAMQAQAKGPTSAGPTPTSGSPGPSLENSPLLPMPLKRAMSANKGHNRPASPSGPHAASSSPSRPSQPSSPLMIQFTTGQHHERRKTSSSSNLSHQSSSGNSLQPGNAFEPPRMPQSMSMGMRPPSAASSPIKTSRVPVLSPDKAPAPRQSSVPTRARSHTVGSQDGDAQQAREPFVPGHYKRRSQLFDISPSSSDNEGPGAKAFLNVQRRRQSSRRMSQISMLEGPMYRPLDVLICEDHPVSKMVMERLLERLRCRTITAVNGSEAMRYAVSNIQFDIIFLEYKLPLINGADVARMIRDTKSANSQTPLVCVTGYLKDLPEAHYFDSLILKPPTLSKLTEVLCKHLPWKPPPKDFHHTHTTNYQPSTTRREQGGNGESPSSTTSSFAPTMPESSVGRSSREDSIGSSFFSDMEALKNEDVPVIINRQATEEWGGNGGLGISEEIITETKPYIHHGFPHLVHTDSAPPVMSTGTRTPRKQRSVDGIKAKRESIEKKRHECAESGDDEDDDLGDVQVRARSPVARIRPSRASSKLGHEMMRTNSRGSVVSGSEELVRGDEGVPRSSVDLLEQKMEDLRIPEEGETPYLGSNTSAIDWQQVQPYGDSEQERPGSRGHITPPIIFPKQPGADVKEFDMDENVTPKPLHTVNLDEEEPTPRPQTTSPSLRFWHRS